jgi:YVTN family beta-propeller protein
VFSRNGKFAYVSNRRDNTISVIDLAARKEAVRITAGEFPQRMTVAMAHRPQ